MSFVGDLDGAQWDVDMYEWTTTVNDWVKIGNLGPDGAAAGGKSSVQLAPAFAWCTLCYQHNQAVSRVPNLEPNYCRSASNSYHWHAAASCFMVDIRASE